MHSFPLPVLMPEIAISMLGHRGWMPIQPIAGCADAFGMLAEPEPTIA
jgi:hypothetical protein